MMRFLPLYLAATLCQGCMTSSNRWSMGSKSEIADICDQLAQISRHDTLRSRKTTMDRFGFETTSYTDGNSWVAVLTRPDLVVVVPHVVGTPATIAAEAETDRMWAAVTVQIEAIQTTAREAKRHIDTVFVAQEVRWTARSKDFHQDMTERFNMRTIRPENALTAAPAPSIYSENGLIDSDVEVEQF